MTRDLRRYASQTNTRLVLGFLLLLVIVGIGSIYLVYGREAALMGLVCLLAGLSPVVLIFLVLWVIERTVKRYRDHS